MKSKNKKSTIFYIGMIFVILLVIGITVAYFSAQKNSDIFTIKSGKFDVEFNTTNTINISNAVPLTNDEYLTDAAINTFTINNAVTSTKDIYVDINITNIYITNNLKTNDFKWELYEEDNMINTGSFDNMTENDDTINIANNIHFPVGGNIKTYKLYIWISETPEDQSNLFNGSFSGKISVTAHSKIINH